jgi:hypothetical protein
VNHATLIVPDVHERIETLKTVLREHRTVDRVVFLCDFWDSTDGLTEKTHEISIWVRDNIKNEKYEFVGGNHDFHYAYPYNSLIGTGWSAPKNFLIRSYMNEQRLWERFRLHTWVGNWLCSHAGFHPSYLHPMLGYKPEALAEMEERTLTQLRLMRPSDPAPALLQHGKSRGGRADVGGVTWLHWKEFEPIKGLSQIVGHTASKNDKVQVKVGEFSINYNLDTHLKSVAIVEDGNVTLEYL